MQRYPRQPALYTQPRETFRVVRRANNQLETVAGELVPAEGTTKFSADRDTDIRASPVTEIACRLFITTRCRLFARPIVI